MQPGDLVRRIVNADFGLALVLRKIGSQHLEILCKDGSVRLVFYDAVEPVDPVQVAPVVV
jgi:hypothetical protein